MQSLLWKTSSFTTYYLLLTKNLLLFFYYLFLVLFTLHSMSRPSWKSFHRGTSFRFGCKEICDCYRDRHFHNLGPVTKENRHYRDDSLNISVHFFQWFPPSIPIMLNIVPKLKEFENFCRDDEYRSSILTQYQPESDYIFADIIDFMRSIIQPLRPNFLIINQGLWKYDDGFRSNKTYLKEFFVTAKASSRFVILVIYIHNLHTYRAIQLLLHCYCYYYH